MNCKQWQETWVAYLYDDVSSDEREVIETHLSVCEACRERMDSLDGTRRILRSAAPEIAAPPRVIVLPTAPRRASSAWSFAGGFAAAAALFVIGVFIGMKYFSTQQTILEANGEFPPAERIATGALEPPPDPRFQQISLDFETLDERLGRVEQWLPETRGSDRPTLATMDRLQTAVGDLYQRVDTRRTNDFQFFVEAILAADQESRRRDARTWQTLGVVHAENNPNARQH